MMWYEAIGKDITDFENLKQRFFERFWSREKQAEVIRKFYTPGRYQSKLRTREQHLLSACSENNYLDNHLSEKSLVGAISRHFGVEIAKHIIATNISTVEEFASMLNAWEQVEKEKELWRKEVRHEVAVNSNVYVNKRDLRSNQERRPENNWERNNYYSQDRECRRGRQTWDLKREAIQEHLRTPRS